MVVGRDRRRCGGGAIRMLSKHVDAGSTGVAEDPGGARIIGGNTRLTGRWTCARREPFPPAISCSTWQAIPSGSGRDRPSRAVGSGWAGRAAADCLAGRVRRGDRRASTLPLRRASPWRADRALGEPPHPDRRRVPQLPPTEPDKTYALQVLEALESRGLRAAIDVRDFRSNEHFLTEMERCVTQSHFVLCVITARYVDSDHCVEEAIISKTVDMAERSRLSYARSSSRSSCRSGCTAWSGSTSRRPRT